MVTSSVRALEVTIDGLVYYLSGSSATVGHVASGNTNKTIEIPASIEYDGLSYIVNRIGHIAFCNYQRNNYYYHVNGTRFYYNEGPYKFSQGPAVGWTYNTVNPANTDNAAYNSYVTTIILPNSITEIGEGAFYNSNLTSVVMQEGVKNIENHAFGRTLITAIHLPSTVTTIDYYAFRDMKKLTRIVIPSSVNSFGENIFLGCDLLRTIIYCGSLRPPTNWVATSQTYVPNTTAYSTPKYSINSAQIYPMIKWGKTEFEYTGKAPSIEWANNVEGYTATLTQTEIKKDAGTWSTTIPIVFTNGEETFTAKNVFKYTISSIPLIVKVENVSRTYGDANPSFTCTYNGFVNNEDASVLTAPPTILTKATATSDVGTYPITASGGTAQNYSFNYVAGELTVLSANLSVTVNDATRVYGDENPAFALTYSGLKNGEAMPAWITTPSFTTDATKTSDAGTYDIYVTCEPKNYTIVTNQPGTLTIEQAPLTLKVDDATRLYYADNPVFTYSCTGFVNDDDVSVLTKQPVITPDAARSSDVGTYALIAKDAEAKNYNISYQPGKMTITKCPLMITADAATREYGEPNPTFTCSYEGFVGGETESVLSELPTVTTMADNYSNAGTYDLRVSGGRATNYTLSYQNGTLTVTKAPLSAKIDDVTRMYGEKNPSSYSVSYFGLKNDESSPAWITKPHAIIEATQSSGVGEYSISASECEALNYDLKEIAPGTLTITPAPLTIQAHDATRKYYSDEPAFSYACYGFVNGDNASVLTTTPTLTTTATLTSGVGTYEIKVGEASTPNYSISYVNGTLTITPRTLTASVGNYERIYNEENPAFVVNYEGFVGDDDVKVLTSNAVASTSATKTSDVGTYKINVTGGNADNYNFSYSSGVLTINKAEQTITWEQDLSNLKVGDQVELKAVASSGLPITYMMDDTHSAEIYNAGERVYLDCKQRGRFPIRAVQNGNKNYYSSPRVSNNVTITEEEAKDYIATLSDAGYATFYDSFYDYKLPSGLKASVITQATDTRLTYKVIADGNSGGIVPAGVAVLLQGKERRADTYTLTPKESTTSYTGTNLLHGSDDATTTTADGDCLFYKLAYGPSGTTLSNTLGWFWGANNGRPFDIEGHKAWLAIPQTSAAKSRALFYSIEGDALDIEGLPLIPSQGEDNPDGEWYDLQGRRVENPTQRGIYIRDGKKVMVK